MTSYVSDPYSYADDDAYDDDDDDDDDTGLRRQALAVDGLPDFDSGPPMDGSEYLRRVAYEARQMPNVMRAHVIDERAYTSVTESASTHSVVRDDEAHLAPPIWATPQREWTRRTVGDFSDLRVRITRTLAMRDSAHNSCAYPANHDRRGWQTLCESEHYPPLSAVLALDAVTCAYLLRHVSSKLHKFGYEYSASDADTDSISEITRLTRWFFAFSARVDLPLDADTSASIRSAMKGAARARMLTTSEHDPAIPHLNLAIAIGGDYFKQWKSSAVAIAE
jgi:gem associated protein 2